VCGFLALHMMYIPKLLNDKNLTWSNIYC